jgi:hypothetical protein
VSCPVSSTHKSDLEAENGLDHHFAPSPRWEIVRYGKLLPRSHACRGLPFAARSAARTGTTLAGLWPVRVASTSATSVSPVQLHAIPMPPLIVIQTGFPFAIFVELLNRPTGAGNGHQTREETLGR